MIGRYEALPGEPVRPATAELRVACRECGTVVPVPCTVPPEPPAGTWVRDRFGALHRNTGAGWGLPGFMPFGRWSAMWHARGPLVECGEWGKDD